MTHLVTPAAAADGATEKAADRAPAEQGMSADVIARMLLWKKKICPGRCLTLPWTLPYSALDVIGLDSRGL
jgi:hypothetical protein